MDLERFIYSFNLVTTLTIKDSKEWVCILNNENEKEIDYSNSINLYHLVESFNRYYCFFKNDYQSLTKLNLGTEMEILKFNSVTSNSDSYRDLIIYIDTPNKYVCNHYEALLYLSSHNEKIQSYITNGLNCWDDCYYRKELELDEKTCKEYLDFGDKYGLLIDSYDFLRNKFIFGNGCTVLFSKINGKLNGMLNDFVITFGNLYFNSEDYIEVVFKLGEDLSIDYDTSKVIFNNLEYTDKKDIIDKLINNLYISRSKLSNMYLNDKTRKLVNN